MTSDKLHSILQRLTTLTETLESNIKPPSIAVTLREACSIRTNPPDFIYVKVYRNFGRLIAQARAQGIIPVLPMMDYFDPEREAYPNVAWSIVKRMFANTFSWLSTVLEKGKKFVTERSWRARDRKTTKSMVNASGKLRKAFDRSEVNTLPPEIVAKLAMFTPTIDDLMRLPKYIPALRDLLVNAEFWVYKLRNDLRFTPSESLTTLQYQVAYTNFYGNMSDLRLNQRPYENAMVARRMRRTKIREHPPFAEFRILFATSIRNMTWWVIPMRDQIKYKWKTMYWMIYLDSILACLIASVYYTNNPTSHPTFSQPCPYRMNWSTFCTAMAKLANTGVPLIDDFLNHLPTTIETQTQKFVNGTSMLLIVNETFMNYIQIVKRRLNLPQAFGLSSLVRSGADNA